MRKKNDGEWEAKGREEGKEERLSKRQLVKKKFK